MKDVQMDLKERNWFSMNFLTTLKILYYWRGLHFIWSECNICSMHRIMEQIELLGNEESVHAYMQWWEIKRPPFSLPPPYSTRSRLDQLLFLIKTRDAKPRCTRDSVVTLNVRKPSHYEMSLEDISHCGLWLLNDVRTTDWPIYFSRLFSSKLLNNGPRLVRELPLT